jgi:hypothetical protein
MVPVTHVAPFDFRQCLTVSRPCCAIKRYRSRQPVRVGEFKVATSAFLLVTFSAVYHVSLQTPPFVSAPPCAVFLSYAFQDARFARSLEFWVLSLALGNPRSEVRMASPGLRRVGNQQ